MAATVLHIGPPAHEDEKAALAFLAEGLPPSATVFTKPWLSEPSGAAYDLDAVVVMPHAVYVVKIKGWRGHLQGDSRDWYVPEPRRSPLLLAHKTAEVLRSLLQRRSHDAGRVCVQELAFLPAAASFSGDAARAVCLPARSTSDPCCCGSSAPAAVLARSAGQAVHPDAAVSPGSSDRPCAAEGPPHDGMSGLCSPAKARPRYAEVLRAASRHRGGYAHSPVWGVAAACL